MAIWAVCGVAFVGLLALSYLVFDRRYQSRAGAGRGSVPAGFARTEEVALDPVTGVRQRVYYNGRTGERIYVEER